VLNLEASKKFIKYVQRGRALRFFIKAEKKMLERQEKKEAAEDKTHEVNEDGLPINCKFKQIEEFHLDRNEFAQEFVEKDKFEPVAVQDVPEDAESSDETEEEFDWYNPEKLQEETYFVFTNLNRRTL
jgi:hypothetical protein